MLSTKDYIKMAYNMAKGDDYISAYGFLDYARMTATNSKLEDKVKNAELKIQKREEKHVLRLG